MTDRDRIIEAVFPVIAARMGWHNRIEEHPLRNTNFAVDVADAALSALDRPEAQDGVAEEDLDARMVAAGMIPLSEILKGDGPMEKWTRHAGMKTFGDFVAWAENKHREFMTLRMRYELGDKPKDDDMYEWVFSHAAVFSGIMPNLRAIQEHRARLARAEG